MFKTMAGGLKAVAVLFALAIGVPIAVAQVGGGVFSPAPTLSSLGAAASGANSDITSLSGLTTPLSGAQGGTGVANTGKTITLGGSVTFSGAFNPTIVVPATGSWTLPAAGTLVNTSVTTLSSLASIGTITTGVWNGTVIDVARGGTGLASYAVGDLLYASGATTISKLAGVATGNALISGGVTTAPSFGKIGLATHVSGNLPVANLNSGTSASSSTFWRGDGTWASAAGASAVTVISVQPFTGSGTYTPNANTLYAIIECVGGGGGGGGVASGANSGGGAGGGGGSYARKWVSIATIGASQTVTIGAAGTAGTAGNNAGGNGGDTSVGTLCVGKGGSGGAGSDGVSGISVGGAGGVAGTGDYAPANGQPGGSSTTVGVAVGIAISGYGGASGGQFGGGATAKISATSGAGNAGAGYGSGGSGGAEYNAGGAAAGGAGTAGYVIITEYRSS